MKIEKTSLADKLLKSLEESATEELLSDKLLKMLGDDTKSAKEYYDEETSGWQMIETKEVQDSDGFMTDYTWYTDNKTKHIFMFGDRDLYSPDEDYADWSIEIDERNPDASFQQAQDWFDNYHGFGSEDYTNEYEDSGAEMDVTHDPLTPVEEGAAIEATENLSVLENDLYNAVNKIYDKLSGLPKPTADSIGGPVFYNSRGNMLELEKYSDGYLVKIGGAYNYDDYKDELNDLQKIFNVYWRQGYSFSDSLQIGDKVYRYYEDVGTNFSKFGFTFRDIPKSSRATEDTVKQGSHWVNKGKEGTHGKFRTKKAADAQRKAMFANGYAGESFATEGVKDILKKYNAELVPGEVDKTYRFKTRQDGNNCEKELRKYDTKYHMNSNGDIIFPSVAKESIRGQVSNNLSKSVYENFVGTKKEVRYDNKKR